MTLEIDKVFRTELIKVLDRYQKRERFERDCIDIRDILENRKYKGKLIEGVCQLKNAVEDHCKEGLRSNTIQLIFGWTWTTTTTRNDLYMELNYTMYKHLPAALIRENQMYIDALKMNPDSDERRAMVERNRQLQEQLEVMTRRAELAEADNKELRDLIEKLQSDNKSLSQKIESSERDIQALESMVRSLKEEIIPRLESKIETLDADLQREKTARREEQRHRAKQQTRTKVRFFQQREPEQASTAKGLGKVEMINVERFVES